MTSIPLLVLASGGLVCLACLCLLGIKRLLRDRPDPALKLSSPVQKFSGWDKQKQDAGIVRSRERYSRRLKEEAEDGQMRKAR